MAKNFDDDAFGLYEATCQACDGHARVNDLGLCETCDGKMDRDLIRMREWAYFNKKAKAENETETLTLLATTPKVPPSIQNRLHPPHRPAL
jgi:hypothetical protein